MSARNYCVGTAIFLLSACSPAEPAKPLPPPPSLEENGLENSAPLRGDASSVAIFGSQLPGYAEERRMGEDSIEIVDDHWSTRDMPKQVSFDTPVVLTWSSGLYLAQASRALAKIASDNGKHRVQRQIWLRAGSVGYPIELMDAKAFQAWMDLPKPGRLRIIQREDGLELQTSIGKLPGPDANGPSLPQIEGHVDVAGLRRAMERLQHRFGEMDGVALVPAFGMEFDTILQALSGMYQSPGRPFFTPLILVYPQPDPRPVVNPSSAVSPQAGAAKH